MILLGDSISLGYREYVRYGVEDFVNVIFPREQGKFAADIFRMLYEWNFEVKDSENIKFVYWNAGLWDVVRIFGDKKQTDEETYKDYLIRTARRLRKLYPQAKICFAYTTRVLEDRYTEKFMRYNKDIEEYNSIARLALANYVDMFDDLYSLTENLSEEDYLDATHFKSNINVILGKHIEQVIKSELKDYIDEYKCILADYNKRNSDFLDHIIENPEKQPVSCWGMGNVFEDYFCLLNEFFCIKSIIDIDKSLWGASIHNIFCIPKEQINKDTAVIIITIDNLYARKEIKEWCIENGIRSFYYEEILSVMWTRYEKNKLCKNNFEFVDADPLKKEKMKKYIGLHITENNCNFDCEYCYLALNPQRRYADLNRRNPHLPQYVRSCLSYKKLGGSCLIGITGSGETMLADGINDLCIELLKEGHYLHIVTNGTVINKIQDLISRAGEYSRHIIFKLSFHYNELKKHNLLDRFSEVVRLIEESKASYTIELLPYDGIIDFISEIKDYSFKNFGALPQLTIARDEKRGTRLLSDMSFEKYISTWKEFDSEMLELRRQLYMTKGKNCLAGPLGFFVDLFSGNVKHCVYHEVVGNIYLNDLSEIDLTKVGNTCPLPYCFNCHVYAALGILPVENVLTYGEIRDRVKTDGSHWIKEEMMSYLKVKLYQESLEVL